MKIEGETVQKGVPTPDNPVEIINIYKDIDYAVKIVESIRNKVTRINVPEQNKEYDIPFLNRTENQAITTVLYRLSEYSEEINMLNNKLNEIKGHIKAELHIIETCRKDISREGNLQYDGMEAAYKCILNCFFMKEETDE